MKGYIVDKCPHCGGTLRQRSTEQNSALHATLQDIAEQKEWMGQRLDPEDWKRLLTAAWVRATGGNVRVVPALDGQGFDVLYRRTSRMTKQELSELLEFVTAWAIDNEVKIAA